MRPHVTVMLFLLLCLSLCACRSEKEGPASPAVVSPQQNSSPPSAMPASNAGTPTPSNEPTPPGIPVTETFDREPQLNLFPRVAAYRPADDDSKGLSFWNSYLEHVLRTSGMRPGSGRNRSNGWVLHGISGLDSISFFAPLKVNPSAHYKVTFDFKGEIPKGGSAGIGVLEFKEFLWVDEQFTEAMCKEFQTGAYPGKMIQTGGEWKTYTFDFTVSPQAGMIHLIFYRDGVMQREKPVVFDNISVTEIKP